jgi:hypothetical protein
VCQFITYQLSASPTTVNNGSTSESAVTFIGLQTGDFVVSVNKPTTQTGLAIAGWRTAGTTIYINFGNATATTTVPTASETYTFVVARGLPTITAALTPAAVAPNTAVEQVFTVQGSGAAATAIINAAGQVIGANVTAGGTGYYTPPEVIFAGGGPANPITSGTYAGLGAPAATATYPYGSGATGIAIVSGGAVTGIRITNPGSGYQIAPAITFAGGNNISLGQTIVGNKPTAQTGLGVANWRIAGNYQVGITFQNFTATTITPTAGESYTFAVLGTAPGCTNLITFGAASSTPGATVGATSTAEQAISVTGITAATDWVVGLSKPSLQLGLITGSARVSATTSNAVYVSYANVSSAAITPTASEVYTITIGKATPPLASVLYPVYTAAFTSVPTVSGSEQSISISGISAGSALNVMPPPGMPAGLTIGGARVSATTAGLCYVNFVNTSTTNSLTPPTGVYQFENFAALGPGVNNWVSIPVSPTKTDVANLANEQQQMLASIGMAQGY